jgi:CheY-like chemotaxis protein
MDPVHILLVEDNEGDILLTKVAFEEANILVNLSVVNDGSDAMEFLKMEGQYVAATIPDLILLDINLPKKNGHEVLKFIKENASTRHIPVIILTTSSSQNDIDLAYSNQVSCFISKPSEVDEFLAAIAAILNTWVTIGSLPSRKKG